MEIKFITNRKDHQVSFEQATIEECEHYLNSIDLIGLDTENSSLYPLHATHLLLQIGDHNKTYVIDRTSVEIEWLNKFKHKKFIGQNLKYDYQILKVIGIELRNLEDIMITEQTLGQGSTRSNSLDSIIERRLNTKATYEKTTRNEFINATKGFIFYDRHIVYAAEDIKYLFPIRKVQQGIIDNLGQRFLLEEIEYPLIPILGDCELEGLYLDVPKWKENIIKNKKEKYRIECELDAELALLSKGDKESFLYGDVPEAKNLQGGKFSRKRNAMPEVVQTDLFGGKEAPIKIKQKANVNYGSPQQVKDIFRQLGEDVPTDKYGKETVGVEHLQKYLIDNPLSRMHNFVKLLIEYSDVSQKIDAFGQGHIDIISPVSKKIHTIYRQVGSATGRFKSGQMKIGFFNSQQIPADNDYRHCFHCGEDYMVLTIDLSSAELIILGSLAKDPKLLELQAKDIHSYLATHAYNNILGDVRKFVKSRGGVILDHHITDVQNLLSGHKPEEKISKEQAEKILRDYIEDGIAITISKQEFGWLRDGFKSVVYGLMYGATAMRISEVLGISKAWAEIVLRTLRFQLPITFKFLDEVAKNAVEKGYIILSERTKARRWFQEILDDKKAKRETSFSIKNSVEREAKNAGIQATNAYIIKEAIVRIENEYIREKSLDAGLVMQVHDELVYKFHKSLLIPSTSPEKIFPEQIHYLLTDTAKRYLAEGVSMGASYYVRETWHK